MLSFFFINTIKLFDMKNFTTYLFIFCLIFPIAVFSQNSVDTKLVEGLAEKIALKIDAKNKDLKKKKRYNNILIDDFTDTEGNVSKLGASLAEEFSLALTDVAVSFSVTCIHDLPQAPERNNKVTMGGLLREADEILDGATKDTDYERRSSDADKAIEGVTKVETRLLENKKSYKGYKGIDAVVTGTLTESMDQYRLLIKVISIRSGNENERIANAKGFIPKTPFILKLEEKENRRPKISANEENILTPKGSKSDSRSKSALQSFASNNTEVELLDIKQVGQNIECFFRLTNTGPDIEFHLYGNNSESKLIDSTNSYDYWATQVKLGEVVDDYLAKKTLVTNYPVEAKVTFGGAATDVYKIAKLNVKCYGHGGTFWIEFRDVEVN